MISKVKIGDIELTLSSPDEFPNIQWIGGEIYMTQLLAAWILVDSKRDIFMNPQILGKPGVGKTTLAYSAAKSLGLPVYIFQCTVDTRPEDLLITPVISENNTIKYHASSLVSAMITGGICILDEANRMSEKSWASLAPLLDQRRYIESLIAGIKIKAHSNFRICCTMNEDSSTFEVPEYIHSRLQPQIFIDFPEKDEEFQILKFNLPFAKKELLAFTVNFLQRAHQSNKEFTARDGINICRYYLKMMEYSNKKSSANENKKGIAHDNQLNIALFNQSVKQILNDEGIKFLSLNKNSKKKKTFLDSPLKEVYNRLMDLDEDDSIDDAFEFRLKKKKDHGKVDDGFELLDSDNDDNDDNLSDDLFLEGDDSMDVIHISEKDDKDKGKDPYDSLDPFFLDELGDITDEKDPNEIIRNFLAKKSKKKKNKKKKKKKKNKDKLDEEEEDKDKAKKK